MAPKQISLTPAKLLKFQNIGEGARKRRSGADDDDDDEGDDDDDDQEEEQVAVQVKKKKNRRKKRRTGWDDAKNDNHRLEAPKPKESKPASDARAAVAALFGR